MHPRYASEAMTSIWSEHNKFKIWFDIEAAAAEALAEHGIIPQESAQSIRKKGSIPYTDERISEIKKIEAETKHDVIAFLTELAQHIGEDSRFVHQGMTSSDVLDTAFNIQLTQASDLLLEDLEKLMKALHKRALEFKDTMTIGRSHGIHGEPVTFGLKLARFYAEFERNYKRLQHAKDEISTCAISGAMGTFAHMGPEIEESVAKKLNLTPETISSQVIPRDRHAMFFATLAVIAGSIENISIEVRHLQRSEVREAEEFFSEKQKGSSAMPHKRNPVLTENLTGLARMIRSYALPALENVALWHERDISHSSVERFIGPDATITLDFALKRLTHVVENLTVYPENMQENLKNTYELYNSQRILLALTQKGVSRENAYRLVQKNAMIAWKTKTSLKQIVEQDEDVLKYLSQNDIQSLFDLDFHKQYVPHIFKRVFSDT